MANLWSVMVACNDPDNGSFQGYSECFDLLAPDGDVALNFTMDGDGSSVIRVDLEPGLLRLGRRQEFAVLRSNDWHGNWCWNRYWLSDEAAARLVRVLWKHASCDGGWSALIDRLGEGERATESLLDESWKTEEPAR